jgi:hypothetical protein
VPAGKPFLALLYQVESAETEASTRTEKASTRTEKGGKGSCDDSTILHDKFEIIIEQNGELEPIHCQEVASEWQYAFFDLSAYSLDSITLTFNLYQSSKESRTSVLLDMITIGQSPRLTEPKSTYLPLLLYKSRRWPHSIYLPLVAR